ncbi:MAG TPA: hypothetical protein DFR83_13035 [Deltaproteobacteria bacterium]|nr:hypothetical protein [Deltaproteobacteria bacterium]
MTPSRFLVLSLTFLGCRGPDNDKDDSGTDPGAPPIITVSLSPSSGVTPNETLTCTASVEDPDEHAVSTSFTWSVDGAAVDATETTELESALAGAFAGGQEVSCTALAEDETGLQSSASATTVVVNQAPEATDVVLDPDPVTTNTVLRAAVTASDADGDPTAVTWSWSVDGAVVQEGEDDSLDGATAFDKGQEIIATATVTDGTDTATVASAPVQVQNSPPTAPEVAITPGAPGAGEALVCGVTADAIDDDSDPLSYTVAWSVDGSAWGSGEDASDPDGEPETTTLEGDTVPAGTTTYGQSWTCTVTASDGEADGAAGTATVTLPDCAYGESEDCPGASCADILTAAGGSGLADGVYILEAGAVSGAPYEAWCLMDTGYDGGGWTLIATYASDGTTTWTYDARRLQDTDTRTVGSISAIEQDFKSPAYHDVLATEVLFLHAPSTIWASYAFDASSPTTLGQEVLDAGGPSTRRAGTGLAMVAGTLTAAGNLNETALYFNANDPDGSYPANTWGPTWNASFNNAVAFDDAANSSIGTESWVPDREINETEGGSGPVRGVGWAYATGDSVGPAGSGNDYLQAFTR